jgi:predicted dehydrogenase
VTIAAVADIDATAAARAAHELGAPAHTPDAVLTASDLDVVYIATPPALHFQQAKRALESGKHVLVEKPLATTVADARELDALSTRHGRVCVANLVERYNPLTDCVKRVIEGGLLGDLLHGLFVNEAADEGLAPAHWFWNREMSGGIFIEHGVHFFDLVASWLGEGHVVSAARSLREPAARRRPCGCLHAAHRAALPLRARVSPGLADGSPRTAARLRAGRTAALRLGAHARAREGIARRGGHRGARRHPAAGRRASRGRV